MSTYGWIIDRDHIDTGAAGTHGPHDIHDELAARLDHGDGHKWRVRDDDGELYYSGRLALDGDRSTIAAYDSELFGPLNDFGAPNAGATTIEYRDVYGKWVTL